MAAFLVKRCCCEWMKPDDTADDPICIGIEKRHTILPTDLAVGDIIASQPAPQQARSGHPRYIRVKKRDSAIGRFEKNRKQVSRSDSSLSRFSAIFQTEELGLGADILHEVKLRGNVTHLERILSELEENCDIELDVHESATKKLVKNAAKDRKKQSAETSSSSGFEELSTITETASVNTASSETMMTPAAKSNKESSNKANSKDIRNRSMEINDSGCSCHDTSSEHGTVTTENSESKKVKVEDKTNGSVIETESNYTRSSKAEDTESNEDGVSTTSSMSDNESKGTAESSLKESSDDGSVSSQPMQRV